MGACRFPALPVRFAPECGVRDWADGSAAVVSAAGNRVDQSSVEDAPMFLDACGCVPLCTLWVVRSSSARGGDSPAQGTLGRSQESNTLLGNQVDVENIFARPWDASKTEGQSQS